MGGTRPRSDAQPWDLPVFSINDRLCGNRGKHKSLGVIKTADFERLPPLFLTAGQAVVHLSYVPPRSLMPVAVFLAVWSGIYCDTCL